MPDFGVTSQAYNQIFISSIGLDSCGPEARLNVTSGAAAGAWPTANKAIYVPFVVRSPFVAMKIFTEIGTASGNIDVGIYDNQKNQLVSGGGVAQAGSSAIQTFDITDTTLNTGVYYMAMAADNNTGTIFRTALSSLIWAGAAGLLMQTSAYPLPSPAVWVAAVDVYLPLIIVTGRTVI